MKTIIDAMYFYAKQGLPVFPLCSHDHSGMTEKHKETCRRPGKCPLIKGWQNFGVPSDKQIETWEKEWSNFNIGLALGSVSGIVGIDVDGEGGKAFLQQLSNSDLPSTLKFTTPNNGMRYLYRIPANQSLTKYTESDPTQTHNECSLLGNGNQTVLPPSIHSNGGQYTWITGQNTDFSKLPNAPKWVIKLMNNHEIISNNTDYKGNSTLDTLASNCEKFHQDWEIQKTTGLSEDEWFRWSSLLVRSAGRNAAQRFSIASTKHDQHSENRISELSHSELKKMVRCKTFGCTEEKIVQCFSGKLRKNTSGTIINSPGSFIKTPKLDSTSPTVNLCDIGFTINKNSGTVTHLNENIYACHLLNNKIDLIYTTGDRFYMYESNVWKYKDGNALDRILRDHLHEYAPDFWTPKKAEIIKDTLKVVAPRIDNLDTNRKLINLKNGMFDLDNFTLIDHNKEYYSTVQLPIIYDNSAVCSTFLSFLDQIFDGDQELIDLTGEIIGYCLTAEVKAQKAFIFYGKGANGKSVLADIIAMLVGKENLSSISLTELEKPFARSELVDKLLNLATENEVGKSGLNTENFKKIVSGDTIRVERKHEQGFSYNPICKLIFAMNNLPYSKDRSYGFQRRLIILPFNRTFSKEEADVHITDKLKVELTGILNFALDGLKRLKRNNFRFTESKAANNMLKEYTEELNPVENFVDEMITKGLPTDRVFNSTLGNTFRTWCYGEGYPNLAQYTPIRLINNITDILKNKQITVEKGKSGGRRYLSGIKLKTSTIRQVSEFEEVEDIDDIA